MTAFPCADLRVLDFSQVLAGPYATRIFAELGADVIKVESPHGDPLRDIAPRSDRGQSGLYTWANLAKRNISIDLGKPEGQALALDLVEHCQIVIQNFRPGVADRLGIGWEAVHARNPRAVMVSVSGFGQSSSRRERGAYAPTIHAAAGLLSYSAEKAESAVHHTGDATADLMTALHSAIAALAAVRQAERTGTGEHVELAMYDTLIATYSETPFALLDPPHYRFDAPPYDAGAHGLIVVAGTPQHVWLQLRLFDPALVDPAAPDADIPTKAQLRHAAIEAWMKTQPSQAELIAALEAAGLAVAPVETLGEALTGPYAQERQLLREVDDRKGGTRPVTRLPYRFSQSACEPQRPAPTLGEHNAEVLGELLGLSKARIDELERAGVLRS